MFRRNSVDVATAARRAEREDAILLDVRRRDEWKQSHVPGVTHVPASVLHNHLNRLHGKQVLVICRSGNRSGRAAATLRRNGVDALNVRGGMLAWARAGLPVVDHRGRRR